MNNKRGLKKRTPFASTLDIELEKKFKELSDITRINQSRLLDEAIGDLLKKYEHLLIEKQSR
ncbi:ribbon-helix-helix domain-containing protein [Paenibacillus allorhizosphaerae]|uniref:Predicted DNA-binding protein ribbon-helix-helix domain-containing protein n=1 Tax=Paenibacillus allorhizosphaerae TaxID=2849866 RepID=A0ABN7U1N8_9BACL|nr:ribbon-helix-helix domain-containing protein [Paenibacillus allorhizosphaerae]CAG7658871.1 hypothetical protein PAECIP111802_07195 [Paenibacillus allorhizosphaerae]